MRRLRESRVWQKLVVVLFVGSIIGTGSIQAQVRDDAGVWFAAFGNGKFKSLEDESPFRWWLDGHYRLLDDAGGFNQSIVRPGIGYYLGDDHTLWGGYAWIRTSPIGPGNDFNEHRLWQQWTFAPKMDRFSFLHRSRLEERFVETDSDVGIRWRQLFRTQYTLSDSDSVLNSEPQSELPSVTEWSLIGWDEAFFNLNDTDWGARTGFDQNRAFFGVGFKPDKADSLRFEVGYLNQFIYRGAAADTMNHIFSINLFF